MTDAIRFESSAGLQRVSKKMPLPTTSGAFEVSLEITRPANTTQYASQDIINTGTNTTLPYFDLGADYANKELVVNYLAIMSDNAAAATKLTCDAKLYSVNNPIADCTDNGAFNPTYAAMKNRIAGFVYADADQPGLGSGGYMVARWKQQQEICHADANGRVYLAAIATNAYTPASGEHLWARMTGFVQ